MHRAWSTENRAWRVTLRRGQHFYRAAEGAAVGQMVQVERVAYEEYALPVKKWSTTLSRFIQVRGRAEIHLRGES